MSALIHFAFKEKIKKWYYENSVQDSEHVNKFFIRPNGFHITYRYFRHSCLHLNAIVLNCGIMIYLRVSFLFFIKNPA